MEDTNTISLALYRYMCQNIVGSENHVKTLRLMTTVRDDINSNCCITCITSGSYGEGLEMRGSDLDIMLVYKDMEVYEDIKLRFKLNVLYLSMNTDDVKPGTTLLQVDQTNSQFQLQYFEELNGKFYFSSALYKQEHIRLTDSVVHGPCISNEDGMFDFAICLHGKTWISQASQWISRSNNAWPSFNVKQSITKHGVLFVPIGVKGSPKEDIEWRISFSVGEKLLINTFTHTQLICYALLKILLKDVIATYAECKDLLCSYFLKTIIFWISEELPQSVWKPENLIPCFMRYFSRLIYCVHYSVCLHYFIPENNMFENKIEGRVREILLEKLYTLHSYGWRCLLFSNQLSNFHVAMSMAFIEPHKLHFIEVAKPLTSALLWLVNHTYIYPHCNHSTYKRGIHQIVSRDQSSLKYVYTYYMSVWGSQYAQSAPLNSTRKGNKNEYKQYNSCLSTLLQNIYHDAVSGWLMVASFFYKTKQYNKALHISIYSLSKCTPEKLYFLIKKLDIHDQLFKLKIFQIDSIVQLWKILLIDHIKFLHNSWLIPNELQMEVENEDCCISSIVYAYFLNILCHYHLNNFRQYQDSIHTLQLVIAEQFLIGNNKVCLSEAYNILGIVLQLSGDQEAARQAYMQSIGIHPGNILCTSVKRLSLM